MPSCAYIQPGSTALSVSTIRRLLKSNTDGVQISLPRLGCSVSAVMFCQQSSGEGEGVPLFFVQHQLKEEMVFSSHSASTQLFQEEEIEEAGELQS